MKKLVSVIFISLVTGSWLVAAPGYLVRGNDSTITITALGERHSIALPEGVQVDMDEATLLAQQQVGDFQYLLLFVTGPSKRGGNGMGPCGAGIESCIIWLQLRAWQVTSAKYQRVESCWKQVTLLEPPHWKDGICVVTFWDFRDNNQEFRLTYDPRKSAAGFQLTSKPFN